jgi:hypothetical protein
VQGGTGPGTAPVVKRPLQDAKDNPGRSSLGLSRALPQLCLGGSRIPAGPWWFSVLHCLNEASPLEGSRTLIRMRDVPALHQMASNTSDFWELSCSGEKNLEGQM